MYQSKTIQIFVLQGRGGTGKTTIVEAALTNLGLNMELDGKGKPVFNPELAQVKFALPTHKAKQVIKQAAGKYTDEDFDTIAGLLGQKPILRLLYRRRKSSLESKI